MEQTPLDYKHYMRPEGRGIKLHLGCGDWWFDGYINIDQGIIGGTDMIVDISKELPFQDNVAEVIESHDVIEHFTQVGIEAMVQDWYRILIKGGRVVGTLPEFEELTKAYIAATGEEKELLKRHVYGIENDHKWGYTYESIKELFSKHGFQDIESRLFETNKDSCPRMEVIAWKR